MAPHRLGGEGGQQTERREMISKTKWAKLWGGQAHLVDVGESVLIPPRDAVLLKRDGLFFALLSRVIAFSAAL